MFVSPLSYQEALLKYQEIMNNLEFARELHKTFITLGQDVRMTDFPKFSFRVVFRMAWSHFTIVCTPVYYHQIQKVVKKSARREQLQREEAEQRRLKTVLELQFLLDRLGDETVRQDMKQGLGGSPPLTDADLAAFDEFYKLVGPHREQNLRLVYGII